MPDKPLQRLDSGYGNEFLFVEAQKTRDPEDSKSKRVDNKVSCVGE